MKKKRKKKKQVRKFDNGCKKKKDLRMMEFGNIS